MSNLLDDFKAVQKGQRVDSNMLVPLMKWFSSKAGNIESMQKINKQFYYVNQKINIVELALNINVKGFMKFPKKPKEDYPMFYINDLAKYFDSTPLEISKTLDVEDLEAYKELISLEFAYDDKERKELNLDKRGLNKCRDKTQKRNQTDLTSF